MAAAYVTPVVAFGNGRRIACTRLPGRFSIERGRVTRLVHRCFPLQRIEHRQVPSRATITIRNNKLLGIGATYPNAFGAPVHFPIGYFASRLRVPTPQRGFCLRHVLMRIPTEIKISRFWSFASISPIKNGGGKGYTAETESFTPLHLPLRLKVL